MITHGRTFDQEAQLAYERYFNDGYFARKQFDTMISQIIDVYKLKPKKVLEIGIGNGFVSSYLRASGIEVVTFDINPKLKPDYVGNILEIETFFEENSFDLILCAEVLEHIPFEHFEPILSKLQKITKSHMILTLPRSHKILLNFSFKLKVPFVSYIERSVFLRLNSSEIFQDHHWQIDYKKVFGFRKLCFILDKKFQITKSYSEKRNRSHQFFIMSKKH
jgi:2-polyprenyl-3-methyl-5-hydroxy-6-metoxy-1,4-benzoquinol methylase